ncbi:MAG: peptidase S9 [Micrococcales bacterium 70-64]|nr:S9 family peptidase [Leifsonia sp.]ODU65255.1 MAG: peptidase S9 [Leifsonia sp. SCN 70-46]OJX86947.1 MAG: peptidase S9 [Micrococcales bacterium 70-64]
MRAQDIESLLSVSRPTLAPDGSVAVVSVTHPSLDADASVGQLWSVPLDGGAARRITRGRIDTSPRFSPDGARIAFLRADKGEPAQLVVVDARGGEPLVLTDAKLGVESFSWSPDSARIAYTAPVAEQGRYGTVEGISPAAEPARHITTLNYKMNGSGYTGDQRAHVFVVAAPPVDGEPAYVASPLPDGSTPEAALVPESTRITTGDDSWSAPRFVGERVVAIARRHAGRDRDLRNQVWSIAAGSEPEALTDLGSLDISDIAEGVDGTVYLVAQELGPDGTDFVGRNSAVYRLDGRMPVLLTDPETSDHTGQLLTATGEGVLIPGLWNGRQHVHAVPGEPITSGDYEVTGVATAAGRVVVSYQSPTSFGEVGVVEGGGIRPLTDFGAALASTGLVAPAELTVTARDGYPVHGWVARPAGEGKHPTLLMIHGGPYTQYGIHAFDETQVYVDAGYAVVYCNPRGSSGYGQAHGSVIREQMGGVDMTDVLDFLDGALDEFDDLDPGRLGILGGSYGGYLTAWTIAHDHRFSAAVVERGYLDPSAFIGSSDIGSFFPQGYNGADRELQRRQSPQEVAHLVTTPTFVVHSELDLRCPLSQAETYYATLKLQGVDAELLVFPGENHELSRSGRPRHRVQRFEAILDWFGRHL